MRYALSAILGLALLACSSGDLAPIAAGDTCKHCNRALDDPKLGARLVTTDSQRHTFHSPLCMADYLVDHPAGAKAMYVTDYPTGKLISVSNALFVRAKGSAKSEREYYAFRHATEAAARAKDESSSVIDWGAVRTLASSQKKGD